MLVNLYGFPLGILWNCFGQLGKEQRFRANCFAGIRGGGHLLGQAGGSVTTVVVARRFGWSEVEFGFQGTFLEGIELLGSSLP